VKALDFPILADENVHLEIIEFLRNAGMDVDSIAEQENFGLSDAEMQRFYDRQRSLKDCINS
jgi:hypothetical protein